MLCYASIRHNNFASPKQTENTIGPWPHILEYYSVSHAVLQATLPYDSPSGNVHTAQQQI